MFWISLRPSRSGLHVAFSRKTSGFLQVCRGGGRPCICGFTRGLLNTKVRSICCPAWDVTQVLGRDRSLSVPHRATGQRWEAPDGGRPPHNRPLCPGGGKSLLPQPGQPRSLPAAWAPRPGGLRSARAPGHGRPEPRERRQRCRSAGRSQVRSRRKRGCGRGVVAGRRAALWGQPLCLCCRCPPWPGPAEEPRRRPAVAAAAPAAAAGGRPAWGAGDERQQSVATR